MFIFARSGIVSGLRSNIARLLFILGIAVLLFAWLGGTFSARAPKTVTFGLGFSLVRIVLAMLVLYWVQELFAKDVERKTVTFSLSYPNPRWHFLVGRYFSVLTLASIAVITFAILLYFSLTFLLPDYQQSLPILMDYHFTIPFIGLFFDLAVISAFGFFFATISTTPMLAFFMGLILSVAARGLGPTLSFILAGANSQRHDLPAQQLAPIVNKIAILLPDLSRLDWRELVMYGTWPEPNLILGAISMSILYSTLIILLASAIFSKREIV